MFTGKAKELFEEWMRPDPLEHGRFGQLVTNTFDNMSPSLQWGVIQDFADSLGYKIIIQYANSGWWYYEFVGVEQLDKFREDFKSCKNTRQEARTEAIKKLNELINQQ